MRKASVYFILTRPSKNKQKSQLISKTTPLPKYIFKILHSNFSYSLDTPKNQGTIWKRQYGRQMDPLGIFLSHPSIG